MYNIKRNKSIIEYLKKQMLRVDNTANMRELFENYILPELGVKDTVAVANLILDMPPPDILDNDTVLIETLKLIGLMEATRDAKELNALISRRKMIKDNKKEKTDFDKILQGLLKVPNNEKGKATN